MKIKRKIIRLQEINMEPIKNGENCYKNVQKSDSEIQREKDLEFEFETGIQAY